MWEYDDSASTLDEFLLQYRKVGNPWQDETVDSAERTMTITPGDDVTKNEYVVRIYAMSSGKKSPPSNEARCKLGLLRVELIQRAKSRICSDQITNFSSSKIFQCSLTTKQYANEQEIKFPNPILYDPTLFHSQAKIIVPTPSMVTPLTTYTERKIRILHGKGLTFISVPESQRSTKGKFRTLNLSLPH